MGASRPCPAAEQFTSTPGVRLGKQSLIRFPFHLRLGLRMEHPVVLAGCLHFPPAVVRPDSVLGRRVHLLGVGSVPVDLVGFPVPS